jgi:hypothetical protein
MWKDKRQGFSKDELTVLVEAYVKCAKYPSLLERRRLALQLGLSNEKVFGWFQNKRARGRRKGLQ